MYFQPILSALRTLKETVDVPGPPLLVVTMISPLPSLAGPTRHTILLADLHSAVSRQLCPQIDRPDEVLHRDSTIIHLLLLLGLTFFNTRGFRYLIERVPNRGSAAYKVPKEAEVTVAHQRGPQLRCPGFLHG